MWLAVFIMNINWELTPQGFTSGGPSAIRIGTRRQISRVNSASLRLRKIGHVRVLGLTRSISSAVRLNRRPSSWRSSVFWQKNANVAPSEKGRAGPVNVSKQNLALR